jgi:6-phosphogluconolactonase
MKPDVRIFEDLNALSEAAAALFIESCAQAVTSRGRALVCLSGGNTPSRLYDRLARSPYTEQVDWPHLHVFWGDERCVPAEDLQSNYRQAHDALLSLVPLPARNIHRVRSEMAPADAALAYALTLQSVAAPPLNWPRFDLVLLGIGDDGHTASLFPGSPVAASVPTAAVKADYEGRPAKRVTITPLFLVSGEGKSESLAHVLYGSFQPELLPAQRIRPTDGELIWLVDQAAAGSL